MRLYRIGIGLIAATIFVHSCKTTTASSKQKSGVVAGREWWQETKQQAQELLSSSRGAESSAANLVQSVQTYQLKYISSPDKTAPEITAASQAQTAALNQEIQQLVKVLTSSDALFLRLQDVLAKGRTNIAANERPSDNNVREIPRNNIINGVDYGIDGVAKLTDDTYQFYDREIKNKVNSLVSIRVSPTNIQQSFADLQQLKDKTALMSANIVQINDRIQTWWKEEAWHWVACAPFAASGIADWTNPTCRWYPHTEKIHLLEPADQPCEGQSVQPDAAGSNVNESPNAIYWQNCLTRHAYIRSKMAMFANDLSSNRPAYRWQGQDLGAFFAQWNERGQEASWNSDANLIARVPTGGEVMSVEVKRPGAPIVCNSAQRRIEVPVTWGANGDYSDLISACGISRYQAPPPVADTCYCAGGPVMPNRQFGSGPTALTEAQQCAAKIRKTAGVLDDPECRLAQAEACTCNPSATAGWVMTGPAGILVPQAQNCVCINDMEIINTLRAIHRKRVKTAVDAGQRPPEPDWIKAPVRR